MTLIDQLHPDDTGTLSARVSKGILAAAGRTLGVAMIARNVEHSIGRTLDVVKKVGWYFRDYHVSVVTNDNDDDTFGALCEATCRNLTWVDSSSGAPDLSGTREVARTVALAEHRNLAMQMLPSDAGQYLVLDCDLLEVTAERLMAGLGDMISGGWDAMAAQNLVLYPPLEREWLINYDAFAYRPAWGDKTNYMIERGFHYDVRPAGTDPYKVRSAFGGACWYRGWLCRGRQYDGSEGCEHVAFNRGLHMAVSPSMSLIGFLGGTA